MDSNQVNFGFRMELPRPYFFWMASCPCLFFENLEKLIHHNYFTLGFRKTGHRRNVTQLRAVGPRFVVQSPINLTLVKVESSKHSWTLIHFNGLTL
jgi:hypothetical protein